MINIDPKSWHTRLYLWYMRSRHDRLQARALQGTGLCPYMRTLLIWVPLWFFVGIPFMFILWVLYIVLWGEQDWHFRPRWAWLGAVIGAPLLIPATQHQNGWSWGSQAAWEVGVLYLAIMLVITTTGLLVLLIIGTENLVTKHGGKRRIYAHIATAPVIAPTMDFAHLLYKYYQTFHTKICPRVQFLQPEVWEEE